jgi:hypothetical protein
MKLFLKNTALFFFITVIILIIDNYKNIEYFYATDKKFMPAKKVTNSYPLNEKLSFLSDTSPAEILAIGSSITVNNLSSNIITKVFKTSSFVNVGSYGFSIAHTAATIATFEDIYKPRTVIICSTLEDFKLNYIKFETTAIKEAIFNQKEINLNDIIFDKYYKSHLRGVKFDKMYNRHNGSLKFDSFGGIPLSFEGFNVNIKSWSSFPDYDAIVGISYKKLESLSNFLASKSIKLIFIHSPIRKSLQDKKYNKHILAHIKKIEVVLNKNNHILVDLSKEHYPDSFFIDYQHLNIVGADSLTVKALQQIAFKFN